MDLSKEEISWALAIKEALTKEDPKLAATITDFEYAHHAIIAKTKVSKALKRIYRLDKFRKDHGIPTTVHDAQKAIDTIEKFENICGGMFLSFGTDNSEISGSGSAVSVLGYNTFVPSKFKTSEDWRACFAAFYYLLDAMQPDFAAVRAGAVVIFESENAGWKNFSYHLEKHAAHLCQNAYPVRIRSAMVLHAPAIFSVMYSLIKPFLGTKLRSVVQLSGTKEQVNAQFPKEIIPISMGGTHTIADKQQAMLEGLKKRYDNMASFQLLNVRVSRIAEGTWKVPSDGNRRVTCSLLSLHGLPKRCTLDAQASRTALW